jgi:hypothetical protein
VLVAFFSATLPQLPHWNFPPKNKENQNKAITNTSYFLKLTDKNALLYLIVG